MKKSFKYIVREGENNVLGTVWDGGWMIGRGGLGMRHDEIFVTKTRSG